MTNTNEKKFRNIVKNGKHCIFYVSEREGIASNGHYRKMDACKGIVDQISRFISDCSVKKYTEYSGEYLNADSIGIVFPAHNWGISLAVYTFLMNLRFKKNTYIYAVVIGESLSGDADATTCKRLKILEQFKRIFDKRCIDNESDIFIRCIDKERNYLRTEEIISEEKDAKTNIQHIMEGMLFYTEKSLTEKKSIKNPEKEHNVDMVAEHNTLNVKTRMLTNIYIDDDIFEGVRLCRVV